MSCCNTSYSWLLFTSPKFINAVVSKMLLPDDSPFSSPMGVKLFPDKENDNQIPRENGNKADPIKMNDSPKSARDEELEATLRMFPPPNYYVHAFYYNWYGNPKFDGKYIHWDHPQLPHWDAKVAQGYPQGDTAHLMTSGPISIPHLELTVRETPLL
ncbi:hypothetical protein INR49_019828 [Caranx melampygus]|nr:hypothetical protein INR49_019828 [Caranx melampygus]